jgi:hypothetical protein
MVSRHLAEPSWLSSFNKITPYALWAGMLLMFAGIAVRDRSWTSRLSFSETSISLRS